MPDGGLAGRFRRLPVAARVFVECVVLLAVIGAAAGWFGKSAAPKAHATGASAPTSVPLTSAPPNTAATSTTPTSSGGPPTSVTDIPAITQSWQIGSFDVTARLLVLHVTLHAILPGIKNNALCGQELLSLLPDGSTVRVDSTVLHNATQSDPSIVMETSSAKDVALSLGKDCQATETAAKVPETTPWTFESVQMDQPVTTVVLERNVRVQLSASPSCSVESGWFVWLGPHVTQGATLDPSTVELTQFDRSASPAQTLANCR